jgi:nitrous oxidase accessory protein NosD
MFMKRFCSLSCQIVSVPCAPNAIKVLRIRKRTSGRNSSILMKMFFICAIVASILASAKVEAQTTIIRVPADQPTIQSAINVATNDDTVLVAPGTYFENINFGGKAITVTSESGPQATIIDGGNANPVVFFISGEGRGSVINGFTLQNGRAGFDSPGFGVGGGITVQQSSPTITNNVIRNNQACGGGGIGVGFGSPLVQRNTITGNGATCNAEIGGGIIIGGASTAEILDNNISDNTSFFGGGIALNLAGTPIIKRNVIKGNDASGQGGGIWMMNGSDALIVQNLIVGNQSFTGAGIYFNVTLDTRGPILVNNTIVVNNASGSGSSGIFADGFYSRTELTNNIIVAEPGQIGLHCGNFTNQNPPIIRFNNIFSGGSMAYFGSCADKTGSDGNISADPRFTNPAQGDYHLQQGSPSIDAGDNLTLNLLDTDFDGDPRILDGDGNGTATVDMGVDEFPAPPVFDICLQDESNGNMLKINSTTGQYLFTRSGGITLGGTGNLTMRGSLIILRAHAADHSVLALIERRLKKAAAFISVPSQGAVLTIVDKNTSDNTCSGT